MLRFLYKAEIIWLSMGVYDEVKTRGLVKCPHCGAKVDDMQTKDLDPILDTYVLVPPLKLYPDKVIEVHDTCAKCDKRISLYLDRKNFKRLPRKKINWTALNRFIAGPRKLKEINKQRTVTAFIPNVEDKVYAKFKEKAAAEGLSEGDAFTKYAKAWLALKEK